MKSDFEKWVKIYREIVDEEKIMESPDYYDECLETMRNECEKLNIAFSDDDFDKYVTEYAIENGFGGWVGDDGFCEYWDIWKKEDKDEKKENLFNDFIAFCIDDKLDNWDPEIYFDNPDEVNELFEVGNGFDLLDSFSKEIRNWLKEKGVL